MNEHVGTNCCIPCCVIYIIPVACFIPLGFSAVFSQSARQPSAADGTSLNNYTNQHCHSKEHCRWDGDIVLSSNVAFECTARLLRFREVPSSYLCPETSYLYWLFVVVFSFPEGVVECNMYASFCHSAINIYS